VFVDLTIAIPTLNCANTLRSTLESVRPLKEAGAKIVVIDSNSSDGTIEIANKFADLLLQVPKGNMYAAVNAGLEHAPAEWMTYLNGDDLLYADAVRHSLNEGESSADVIYGCIDYIDEMGRFLHGWTSPQPRDYLALAAGCIMPIPQQGTVFRRSVFEGLKGFDIQYRFSGDFDFFLRAKLAGFRFLRQRTPRIGAFRLHPLQITQSRNADMIDEAMASMRANRLSVGRWHRVAAFARFRGRNWDAYLLRLMRSRQLAGSSRLQRTMGVN
jgi:glycosyltransferase involved in cell wall biosynthesis